MRVQRYYKKTNQKVKERIVLLNNLKAGGALGAFVFFVRCEHYATHSGCVLIGYINSQRTTP